MAPNLALFNTLVEVEACISNIVFGSSITCILITLPGYTRVPPAQLVLVTGLLLMS